MVKNLRLPLSQTNSEVRKCCYQYKQFNIAVWNKLLRREFIIDNHLLCREGIIYEDWLWMFYLVKHLKKACFLSDVTYYQKMRPGSITTGTDIRTRMANHGIVFREVLNQLTPGHEQEELKYYSIRIAYLYCKYVREVPAFEEVLLLCQKKNEQFGCRYLTLKLTVIYYLGKFKYVLVLMALMKRIKQPSLLLKDICNLRWSWSSNNS